MVGKLKSLRELFEIELGYAYDCEKKLAEKGLPTMIEKATSVELRDSAPSPPRRVSRAAITRLEQVFRAIGIEPKANGNEILDKMMSAAKDSVGHTDETSLRDAALIANGNQVEHYEIALYGTLSSFARSLGLSGAVGPLEETLNEEKKADAKLSQIAEKVMNPQAARRPPRNAQEVRFDPRSRTRQESSTRCTGGSSWADVPLRGFLSAAIA